MTLGPESRRPLICGNGPGLPIFPACRDRGIVMRMPTSIKSKVVERAPAARLDRHTSPSPVVPKPPPPRDPDLVPEVLHPFRADIDLTELDDRSRLGMTWTGRSSELNRTKLVFWSRRMCYPGRYILVAVHLVDDAPVPLFGSVSCCEYVGEGLHEVELDLMPVPDHPRFKDWLRSRELRGSF